MVVMNEAIFVQERIPCVVIAAGWALIATCLHSDVIRVSCGVLEK